MLNGGDAEYLLRVLGRNDVALFLGAGFSRDARNSLGEPLPLSHELAESLWNLLDYGIPYDGTSLPDMYDAALGSGVPHSRIKMLLEQYLITTEVPPIYDVATEVYWYRIYTTNIDDLLPTIYARAMDSPRLDVLAYPGEPEERDPSLESMQAIFLHGALPCQPDDITFSVRQFARRAGETSPLYEQFVRDYATKPTVFIGTELNEPLFWQHIEARERRTPEYSEQRPKSFLVAPRISPPKRTQLSAFNVVPIEADTGTFLNWLIEQRPRLPSRREVLRTSLPSVVAAFDRVGGTPERTGSLLEFAESFHAIPSELAVSGDRSFYLLGASPRWEDLFRDLDAPRNVTSEIISEADSVFADADVPRVIAILGSAGCGKSTILRRLGLRLSQAGRTVFLSNSEDVPPGHVVGNALSEIQSRCVLLFDNAEVALNRLPEIYTETASLPNPPLLIIAARANEYDRRASRLEPVTDVTEIDVPDLTREEIEGLLAVLDANGLLGTLQGMSHQDRIREFEDRQRANKQLLVAMREATTGRGFDRIIEDEFRTLLNAEIKLLYLCVSLATSAGYRLSEQQFVACAEVSPGDALHILKRNLRSIVIPTGPKEDLLLLRHRVIAELVLDSIAPRNLVSEAYIRLLRVLAPEIRGTRRRSRTLGLYKQLLNHRTLFRRFADTIDEARAVYDSVVRFAAGQSDYWLQYGLLELEYGNLVLAENYLRQAESLFPESDYIQNSIGQLLFKKGIEAESLRQAVKFRDEASELLERQMVVDDSPYPYHIYCVQRLQWCRQWVSDKAELQEQLENLRRVAKEGRRKYSRNKKLERLERELDEEYMYLTVS